MASADFQFKINSVIKKIDKEISVLERQKDTINADVEYELDNLVSEYLSKNNFKIEDLDSFKNNFKKKHSPFLLKQKINVIDNTIIKLNKFKNDISFALENTNKGKSVNDEELCISGTSKVGAYCDVTNRY